MYGRFIQFGGKQGSGIDQVEGLDHICGPFLVFTEMGRPDVGFICQSVGMYFQDIDYGWILYVLMV